MNSGDRNENVPSAIEVTAFLTDEGFYDPLLSEQEMLELYQAVSNSKNTATAEDEKRRILEDTQQDDDMLDELRLNSVPVIKDDLNTTGSINSDASTNSKDTSQEINQNVSNNFDDVDVFNSIPVTHPPLPRISYKPKYNPPLYSNPKISHLSFEEKKKLIASYHKRLIDMYDSYQRLSVNYAPLDKPIHSDIRFNGNLFKTESKSNSFEFEDDRTYEHLQDDNLNDVYILRSGRQTKRKLYSENRNDEKKSKHTDTSTPTKRRLTNDVSLDEANRTKVVSERNKNRSEKLFDSLVESQKKQNEKEKENEQFFKSLHVVSDGEDDFKEEIESIHVEEPFIRRRVVPPLRGRGQRTRSGKTNNSKNKKTATNKGPLNDITYESLETTNYSSTSGQADDFGTCPICSLRFPNDKLESHADQCIDFHEEQSSVIGLNKIACEKCDKVLLLDMNYELHVQECLAKSNSP